MKLDDFMEHRCRYGAGLPRYDHLLMKRPSPGLSHGYGPYLQTRIKVKFEFIRRTDWASEISNDLH